jgi:phosphatidylglycerophosphatase A
LFLATLCGLGYIPVAPEIFGSLAGLALALSIYQLLSAVPIIGGIQLVFIHGIPVDPLLFLQCLLAIVLAIVGVWSAGRASRYWQQKNLQRVIIGTASGQHLALVPGSALPVWWRPETSWAPPPLGFITYQSALGWKYLLLGVLLFLLFDFWKPFPVRQAHSLPGGLGITAGDWVAALYAALGIWLARVFGL